jgi:hypothetical protein
MRFLLWLATLPLLAQKPLCDPELTRYTNRNDPDRYINRGDRCEGVYNEPVSGDNGRLWIASFTAGAPLAKWQGPLDLRWLRPTNPAETTIQAHSLRPHSFYRLDSRQPSATYRWPTDLIARYLPPAEVGLVAFTDVALEGRSTRVYLPLSLATNTGAPYRLTMVPTVELTGATVLVSPVGGKPLQERRKLPVGPIVRGQPFLVDLPALPRPGYYRIDVLGQTRSSGVITSAPLVIYHAP